MKIAPTYIDEDLKRGYALVNIEHLKRHEPKLLYNLADYFNTLAEHNEVVELRGIEKGREEMR